MGVNIEIKKANVIEQVNETACVKIIVVQDEEL